MTQPQGLALAYALSKGSSEMIGGLVDIFWMNEVQDEDEIGRQKLTSCAKICTDIAWYGIQVCSRKRFLISHILHWTMQAGLDTEHITYCNMQRSKEGFL
jgi:hypothetical protein